LGAARPVACTPVARKSFVPLEPPPATRYMTPR